MLPIITEAAIGAATVETVNARDLHAFLENRDHFATWIKDRIRVYGFTEHVDFTTYSAVSEKGGRPSTEYAVSLDMGKELAMVERNDRGREARRYFIDCERRAKVAQPAPPAVPQSLPEALRLAADLAEQVDRQKAEIAVLGPRSEALAVIADADGTYAITDAAKTLQMPPGELRDWLFRNQWVYRRDRDGSTVAYQSKILAGYMVHKAVAVPTAGRPWIKSQARVTTKGLAALAQRIPLDRPGGLFGPTAPAA